MRKKHELVNKTSFVIETRKNLKSYRSFLATNVQNFSFSLIEISFVFAENENSSLTTPNPTLICRFSKKIVYSAPILSHSFTLIM